MCRVRFSIKRNTTLVTTRVVMLFHVMRKTMIQTERVLDGQEDKEDFAVRLWADIVVR